MTNQDTSLFRRVSASLVVDTNHNENYTTWAEPDVESHPTK